VGDLKLTNKGSGIFLNNCIRNGRHALNAQRLHLYQAQRPQESPESASGLSVRSVVYETENHRHDGCAFLSANALAAIKITGGRPKTWTMCRA
jgi:hypothetical protein